MNDFELNVARAIMQIKAEPHCTECGGSCLVVMDDIQPEKSSKIWTMCTVCGTEMLWTATPNHVEMLKRIAALTIQQEGKVVEDFEFVRNPDGTCAGLCGGICHEHWEENYVPEDSDDNDGSSPGDESS